MVPFNSRHGLCKDLFFIYIVTVYKPRVLTALLMLITAEFLNVSNVSPLPGCQSVVSAIMMFFFLWLFTNKNLVQGRRTGKCYTTGHLWNPMVVHVWMFY